MRLITKNSANITTLTVGNTTQLREASDSSDFVIPAPESHADTAAPVKARIPHTLLCENFFTFSTALIIPYMLESFAAQ
jgi:hypothetical protein